MKIVAISVPMLLIVFTLAGCVNSPRMGQSASLLKVEQTYNPNATRENKDLVPAGSGERAQSDIKGYNKGASENISVSSGFGAQ